MQHRVVIHCVLGDTVELLGSADDLTALVARHNLLLPLMQRPIDISGKALLVASGFKEATFIVHAHEMTILVPVLNEILLITGRSANVSTGLPMHLGAHSEVLVRRVERERTASIIAYVLSLVNLLRRHNIHGCGVRSFWQIASHVASILLQLFLVVLLDLEAHSVVIKHRVSALS